MVYYDDKVRIMRKMLFIFNPRSGKAQIRNRLMDILDIFTKAGYEVSVHVTQRPKDAMEVAAARGKDADIIVCSGGDGSVSGTFRCLKSHRSAPADDHSVRAAAVAAVCVRAAAACLRETALPPVRRLLL